MMPIQEKKTDAGRRDFTRAFGSLVIGWPFVGQIDVHRSNHATSDKLPSSLARHRRLDQWLEVLGDNRVRVFTGKIELGQGITTVIRQVAADELCMLIGRVEVVMANTKKTPNERYTAGSGSVKGSAMSVRYAAAFAREHLCRMAADRWGVKHSHLYLKDGAIHDPKKERSLTIDDLLEGRHWNVEVELPVVTLPKDEYRYVGKSIVGESIEKLVAGTSYFVHDLEFPGMLHARIHRPSTEKFEPSSFDPEDLKKHIPGQVDLVTDGHMLGLVGPHEYEVVRALSQLERHTTWPEQHGSHTHVNFKDSLVQMATEHEQVLGDDISPHLRSAIQFSGSFYKPYTMHGSMGPACAIAHTENDHLTIWTHSQGVFPLRSALAALLKKAEDDITVVGVPGAGCFGHSTADDAAADAAILAMRYHGRYIKVQWTRQQEHRWEPLGCAMRVDVKAGLTHSGEISFWKSDVYTDSHSTRPNKDPGTLLTARFLEHRMPMQGRGYVRGGYRNAEPYYKIGAKNIDAHYYEGPLRVSSLRSLGAFANVFAIESIIDMMCVHRKAHPLDFRIGISEDPRAIAVLEKLKEITNGITVGRPEGLGFAFARYKNTDAYCAMGAHVQVGQGGKVRLLKLWATVDAGEIMNPDGLSNQIEGAMIQASSWTLLEAVTFEGHHITAQNWASYPMLRFDEVPATEVILLPRPSEPALGGGELATVPTAAAITNAIFNATGIRVYDLPVKGFAH